MTNWGYNSVSTGMVLPEYIALNNQRLKLLEQPVNRPPSRTVFIGDYAKMGSLGDNSPAINDALRTAGNGGLVLWPDATFGINSTLNHSYHDQTWLGFGTGTVLRPLSASFNLVTLSVAAHRARFLGLWLKGGATNDSTTQFGIFTGALAAPDDVEVNECFFGESSSSGTSLNSGIKIDGGSGWNVHDCKTKYLWGSISNTGYGVLAGTTAKLHAHDNEYLGTTGRGRHAVYLSGGCTYCNVHDNTSDALCEEAFPMYSQGVQAANAHNHVHDNTAINGGQLTSTGAAYSIFGLATYNKISDNKAIGYQGDGFTINRSGQSSSPVGNVFEGNEASGCSWRGFSNIGADNTTFRGNEARDISQASPGTYAGFDVRADLVGGTTYSTKTTFQVNRAYGTTLRAGLSINEAGNTGTVALANDFPDGTVANIITNAAPLINTGNNAPVVT